MWVNRKLFDLILADNKHQSAQLQVCYEANGVLSGENLGLKTQKAKDDLHIDWLRHRVNALEKQNSILVMKTSGVQFPVPEIVPTRPGTMSDLPDFQTMPSFEDVGDAEATRLGIALTEDGQVEYQR